MDASRRFPLNDFGDAHIANLPRTQSYIQKLWMRAEAAYPG